MTLKQAFTIWSLSSKNTVLAANSREAVQKVLMKKYNDIDLEQITPAFARRIFSESTEIKEIRVKAASILVHVLKWGSENGTANHHRSILTSLLKAMWRMKNRNRVSVRLSSVRTP